MEEEIETKVSCKEVWKTWERAHSLYGQGSIEKGQKGKSTFKYKILDVQDGESFSILWKALFVKLIFNQRVRPTNNGSKITYQVQIKGLFAPLIRLMLAGKIRNNIRAVLKSIVKELENQSIK